MAKIAKRRGKWVVDWYDPVTKKRSREVCADRDAAKRRLGEVLKSGERIGLKSTLKEYAEKWLEHMKNELAEFYSSGIFRRFKEPHLSCFR
jgi:hypothetical protein